MTGPVADLGFLNDRCRLCVYEFPSVFGYLDWSLELRLVCRAWQQVFDDFAPKNMYCDHNTSVEIRRRSCEIAHLRWIGLNCWPTTEYQCRALESVPASVYRVSISDCDWVDSSVLATLGHHVRELNLMRCRNITD